MNYPLFSNGLPRFQTIKVSTLSATETKPVRVKIQSLYRKNDLVYKSFGAKDNNENSHTLAIKYLKENGFNVVCESFCTDGTSLLMVSDFKALLDKI